MRGRGMAQKSLDLIERARCVLAAIHPTSSRGVAYQLFIRGLIERQLAGLPQWRPGNRGGRP